jgi:hypothetical protein
MIKSIISNLSHLFNFWYLDKSCCRDNVNRAAGRRSGALFFARHLDCFIITRQFASIYRDLVPSRQIIVTQNLSLHLPGLAKNSPTPTQTAPNQTAGPLAANFLPSNLFNTYISLIFVRTNRN